MSAVPFPPRRPKPESQKRRSARAKLKSAHEDIVTACRLLREDNLSWFADLLMGIARQLHVWIQKDGWMDQLDLEPIAEVHEPAEEPQR